MQDMMQAANQAIAVQDAARAAAEVAAAERRDRVEELPSVFMNFLIGNGYWLSDKIDGTYRNYLYISHTFGFTPAEVLIAHDRAVAYEQQLYLNSESAKTLSGRLGASGFLTMLVTAPVLGVTNSVLSSVRTGAVYAAADSLFSASVNPSFTNTVEHTAAGAAFGTLGYGIFKAGSVVYKTTAVPAVSAVIDTVRYIDFNKFFQEELRAAGQQIMSKNISFLTHGIDYAKQKVHSAVTGALGEANTHYVLEKVMVKRYGYTHMISKYDKVHGFDGVYIKMDPNGQIANIIFAESKASSRSVVHGLSQDSDGVQQLSKEHIDKTLKRLRDCEPIANQVEKIQSFLRDENNWSHVKRMLAKTNGSGWTQWHEAVGGIIPGSRVTLRPLTDGFKLVQKHSNTLTLKRRAAAGLLPGVAAANAYADPEYADTEIDIVAPTDAEMAAMLSDNTLDGNFPHDIDLEMQTATRNGRTPNGTTPAWEALKAADAAAEAERAAVAQAAAAQAAAARAAADAAQDDYANALYGYRSDHNDRPDYGGNSNGYSGVGSLSYGDGGYTGDYTEGGSWTCTGDIRGNDSGGGGMSCRRG